MTFGQALDTVVQLYGGTSAVARRLGVTRWTVYRWRRMSSAGRMSVDRWERLLRCFPELRTMLQQPFQGDEQ